MILLRLGGEAARVPMAERAVVSFGCRADTPAEVLSCHAPHSAMQAWNAGAGHGTLLAVPEHWKTPMKLLPALSAVLLLAACADAGTAPVSADPPAAQAATAEPAAATVAASAQGFCAADEQVVFGCRSGAGRIDAVCASPDLSEGTGGLQYRQSAGGDTRHVVLAYPAAGVAASQAFRGGTLMYSGGGGAFLRFDHDGRVHTLYTGIGRGWEKAGVVVQPVAGGAADELTCEGEVESTIGPALFDQAGIADDPAGFEIP
ncbi:hypothetical protein LDO26_09640 [Luteimonas sp. BDR2-5]|uniref:hypothetical protein n=1 Tax=Proluteimonas luteida TaxID=2878685 RepID=UPI001E462B69|nr:hypothetical protein [Luteimonas sp. BDR2-5]MCD9028469.1 hypothetical protein [Luteimonas sp. BDR2-5]